MDLLCMWVWCQFHSQCSLQDKSHPSRSQPCISRGAGLRCNPTSHTSLLWLVVCWSSCVQRQFCPCRLHCPRKWLCQPLCTSLAKNHGTYGSDVCHVCLMLLPTCQKSDWSALNVLYKKLVKFKKSFFCGCLFFWKGLPFPVWAFPPRWICKLNPNELENVPFAVKSLLKM